MGIRDFRAIGRLVLLVGAIILSSARAPADTVPAVPAGPAARITGSAARYHPPDDIAFRVVSIMSEGVRLQGELFYLKASEGQKLPTVIMAHGWGGVAAYFREDAEALAAAGYLVLTFDYRGWGDSDARVILRGPEPDHADDRFTTEVQAIAGYIDPFEQVADWFNVIDWASAEPMVDTDRIGLRGSSFSGGQVVYVAGRDPRIKAIVSQVGGIADRPDTSKTETSAFVENARRKAAAMARGDASYPEPEAKVIGNLVGAPVGDKLLRWWPNEEASHVKAAALFILAGNEELVDNKTNGELEFARVQGPKQLVIIPDIRHYDIYGAKREEAIRLAIDWFDAHLKP